jgi:hypothetical protein
MSLVCPFNKPSASKLSPNDDASQPSGSGPHQQTNIGFQKVSGSNIISIFFRRGQNNDVMFII